MSASPTLRIATRGSAQATAQSTSIADAITATTGIGCELVVVETLGDRTQASGVPLHSIGGQGVFVKEVQRAVLDGRADLAVHSAKDLPAAPADGLTIAAFAERRRANDALVGSTLDGLRPGAVVATGSVRRRAQLRAQRPDLAFAELRGNIGTRLERVPESGAIVIALAALEILGMTDRADEILDVDRFVPAVGQGCVAVECRRDDLDAQSSIATIDDAPTRRSVSIERAFLAALGGGCSLPVGAYAVGDTLRAFVGSLDGDVAAADAIALVSDPHGDDHDAVARDQANAAVLAAELSRRVG